MPRDTTTSSFKAPSRLPGGFLIVLALFLITETAVYSARPHLVDDFWNKLIINEQTFIDKSADSDYLIMGDSLQRTGINPAQVNGKLLSLCLPGAKPQGLYLLLKRYLKRRKPPKVIFLFVDPEDPKDSLFVILRYFVSIPEFVSIWKDLSWAERRCFVFRYWASLDLRRVGLTVRDKYPYGNRAFVDTLIRNRGYMPSPRADRAIEDDHFAKTRDRIQRGVAISKRDMKYLDKFVNLASSYNIRIVFLGMVLPKELHDIFEKTGFNRDYLIFTTVLKRLYPRAYFVDAPILYLENKHFGDMIHVNKEGSQVYTEYFKNQVFTPFAEAVGQT